MIAEKDLAEYLAEIREQVCSRCIERPPNGPPCAPLGKDCGIELHLPQLIESIRAVHSPMLMPYLEHNRSEICEKCALLHSSICPCPMDYMSALVVEAVEAVDKRHEDSERERDFLASRSDWRPADVDEVRRAYEEARGTWTGCDWPTHFGANALDLNGLTPADAEAMATQTAGTKVCADWRAAVSWLAQVQHHAEQAEAHAATTLRAAEAGDWHQAARHAERAFALEFATGRALRRPYPLTWQRLHDTVKEASRQQGSACWEMQAQD
jgi:hypothetical protein